MQDGLYAKFNATKGEILVALEYQKTPGTVGNFVALAEGDMENSVKPQGTLYYDGLKFHRCRLTILDRQYPGDHCIHQG